MAPYQNPSNFLDVDDDGYVTPIDATYGGGDGEREAGGLVSLAGELHLAVGEFARFSLPTHGVADFLEPADIPSPSDNSADLLRPQVDQQNDWLASPGQGDASRASAAVPGNRLRPCRRFRQVWPSGVNLPRPAATARDKAG